MSEKQVHGDSQFFPPNPDFTKGDPSISDGGKPAGETKNFCGEGVEIESARKLLIEFYEQPLYLIRDEDGRIDIEKGYGEKVRKGKLEFCISMIELLGLKKDILFQPSPGDAERRG